MVYVEIMGMTRTVWVGQERVWVGHGLIARTASAKGIIRSGCQSAAFVQIDLVTMISPESFDQS